jgi:16S rRNA (uracil1498-N3)-methyltransferase
LVGPEGGFTDGEMALAVKRGLTPVHLGPRVLRADTAAIAALAVLAAVAGDGR